MQTAMEALRNYDEDASLESMLEPFHRNGFVVFHHAIDPQVVSMLRTRLDDGTAAGRHPTRCLSPVAFKSNDGVITRFWLFPN